MDENGAPVSEMPIGLLKQASMKLASAMNDLNEIREDDWASEGVKDQLATAGEAVGNIIAYLTNVAMEEVDEETFLREEIEMDEIAEVEYDTVEELDPMEYPDEWD